jgi:hypothetical protein
VNDGIKLAAYRLFDPEKKTGPSPVSRPLAK